VAAYTWGVKELDALSGGIEKCLWMFFGKAGSGKTTLSAYQPICRIAEFFLETVGEIPPKGRFVVMDGDGGFALDRLQQICEARGIPFGEVKSRLVQVEFTTFQEQHSFICGPSRRKEAEAAEEAAEEKLLPPNVRETLKEVSAKGLEGWLEEKGLRPLMITFDPMTAIYRGILLRTPLYSRTVAMQPYSGKLDLQLATLRRLGVVYSCPVFVTTWPSSPLGKAMAAAAEKKGKELPPPEQPFLGGRSFSFFPKQIWEIRMPEEGQPVRVVSVWKSRTGPTGRTARFRLSDRGIEGV
jgi:hypothetical protein